MTARRRSPGPADDLRGGSATGNAPFVSTGVRGGERWQTMSWNCSEAVGYKYSIAPLRTVILGTAGA